MTTTTYYDLNIVEGTDIVNPLTVDNPNYQKIDETMHNNAVAGVTLATEIANATVHAITRENSDCSVIRFIATSRWKAGDTATVDGVPVTALLPNGETLPDGAYVINANILCILTGTNLTVYVGGNKVENAHQIPYNDTNVGAELDKLNVSVEQINSNLTVRYNQETDMIQIKDSEGVWHDYASGKLKYYKLYTNGVQNVTWDNGVYSMSSTSALDGGFTLNDLDIVVPPVTTDGHNYSFVTRQSIDFSKYSKLKMILDGEEKSYDIGSINIYGYIGFASFYGSGLCHLGVFLSSTKENFADPDRRVFYAYPYQSAVQKNLRITEIWLEP